MKLLRSTLKILQYSVDFVLICFSLLIAVLITNQQIINEFSISRIFSLFVILMAWYLAANSNGLYDENRSRYFSFELLIIIKTVLFQVIVSILLLFVFEKLYLKRIFVFYYPLFLFISVSIVKLAENYLLHYFRKKGRNLRQLLIVGAGEVGQSIYNEILRNVQYGYNIVGFLDDFEISFNKELYTGKISDLEKVLHSNQIDVVIIALPNYSADKLDWIMTTCEQNSVRVNIISDYYKLKSKKFEISTYGVLPVISVRNERLKESFSRILKRSFDIVVALLVSFIVLIWLVPIICLAIKLDSRGPIFFKQERWGRNNKRFRTYKFRSMVIESQDLNEHGEFQQAKKGDPRITKIGQYLRKTNLDELPQFFNVLKGEMSIVGPRPHPTPLNLQSMDTIRYYMLRHLVNPGITGWAQVNGFRGETTDPQKMQERVIRDLWYIENWSLGLDIQIVLLTIILLFRGDKNAY